MKILIIEDQQMFADAIRATCLRHFRLATVEVVHNGIMGVEQALKWRPDLVLLDLELPGLDGFEVIRRVRPRAPEVRFLILSSHCDPYTVFRVERSGTSGYIDKTSNSIEDLREAITTIREGGRHFSRRFLEAQQARQRDARAFDKLLSDHQQTILAMIGAGWSNAEIAAELKFTPDTAEKHRYNIRKILGLPTPRQLADYARANGFTTVQPRPVRPGRPALDETVTTEDAGPDWPQPAD